MTASTSIFLSNLFYYRIFFFYNNLRNYINFEKNLPSTVRGLIQLLTSLDGRFGKNAQGMVRDACAVSFNTCVY